MIIKFKKLSDTAITPTKGHYNDAGFDLYADEDATLVYGETKAIATNIALELPDGYMADVRPRSGLTSKTALRVHYGTVDAGYRGGIGVICQNGAKAQMDGRWNNSMESMEYELYSKTVNIKRGDKIAQLVIQKIPDVQLVESDELNDTVRGEGGFGSTGN